MGLVERCKIIIIMSTSKKKYPRSRQLVSVETFRSHAAEDVLKAALEELGWKNVRTFLLEKWRDCVYNKSEPLILHAGHSCKQ